MSEVETVNAEPDHNPQDVVVVDGKVQELRAPTPKPETGKGSDDDADENEETAEIEPDDEPEAKADDADDDSEEQADDEADAKPKKRNPIQRRFDELTRQKHEAERRAQDAERRAQAAEAKLQNRPELDPDDFDGRERQHVKDAINEQAAEEARIEAEAAKAEVRRTRNQGYLSRAEETLGERFVEFKQSFASIPLSDSACDVLAESESGVEMGMYLSKHPAEARRIYELSPVKQARELTKLESRLESATRKKRQTSAPPPPKTIETATAAPVQKDPAQMSDAEYSKWYRKRNKLE